MELLLIASGNIKWNKYCRKQFSIAQKTKTKVPCDPAILLVYIYSKELKTVTKTYTRTPLFIAAFTIAKVGKSKCPLTKWISKMWYKHTMEY